MSEGMSQCCRRAPGCATRFRCAPRRTERGSLTCAGRGSPAGRRAPRPFARCARAAARRPWPLRPKTSRRARHRRLSVCSDDGGNRLSRRARHSTRRYSCASSRRLSACRLRRVDGSRAARAASLGRHEAAEASHAARVAVRERLRLRGAVLSLQRAARAFSARRRLAEGRAAVAEMQLGAAYREEALLVQLRHVERSRSTIHLHRRRVGGRSGRGGRNTHPPTHPPTHLPLCTHPLTLIF